jgi:hypothetical protein
MKNIQVIDGAVNCVYDIFAATDDEFESLFAPNTDIAFIDEIFANGDKARLAEVFNALWTRPVAKSHANGIHGIIFYELEEKKQFYPTRRDEEAINPDGSLLRAQRLD